LHYQLLDLGLSVPETVLIFYVIALIFGLIAVSSGTLGKIVGLLAVALVMAGLIGMTYFKNRFHGQEE
jgi:hypothetical protein